MINLNYLRYFYICAQSESFTRAAERLGISQPSLSVQIKTFEEQLGFDLFVRSGRSLSMTPKGQGLFLYASKVFEITAEIDTFLKKSERNPDQTLNIGVSDEVERPFVAEITGRFLKLNSSKKINPSIISGKHQEMIKMVAEESIDILITNKKISDLKLVSSISIPVMLISSQKSSNSKIHQHGIENLLKLLGQSLIMPTEKMILAKETKSFLRSHDCKVPIGLTSNILACISRSVLENLGVAFLPIMYVQKEIKNGILNAFGPRAGYWQHHLYLYVSKKTENQFVESFSRVVQDFNALKIDLSHSEVQM